MRLALAGQASAELEKLRVAPAEPGKPPSAPIELAALRSVPADFAP
jgi:hypothetical protein